MRLGVEVAGCWSGVGCVGGGGWSGLGGRLAVGWVLGVFGFLWAVGRVGGDGRSVWVLVVMVVGCRVFSRRLRLGASLGVGGGGALWF